MSADTKYKFSKGDRVRVKPGQFGTIDESESDIPFVNLDNGGRFSIRQKDMELITSEPEQQTRRKGERVRILPGATGSAGTHSGEIVTIDENLSDVPWCLTDKGERFAASLREMEDAPAYSWSPLPPRPALLPTAVPEPTTAQPEPLAPLSPAPAATELTRSFTKQVLTAEARAFVNLHFPTCSHGKGGIYYHQIGVFAEFIESVFPDNT